MKPDRFLLAGLCLVLIALVAWLGNAVRGDRAAGGWKEVMPGVWRSPGLPAGYALVDGAAALLVDAPTDGDGLKPHGARKIDTVLLTHHHRDTCAAAGVLLGRGVPVRAPRDEAAWLKPDGVRKYWQESLPLRNSRTAYLVVPEGFETVDCSLADGQRFDWHGWQLQVLGTPGHSPGHLAFAARKGKDGDLLIFCGDAWAAPDKLWSPYTTDWDHWTDAGLTPAAKSLRQLADRKPAVLLPAHGDVIHNDPVDALTRTARAVEEMAFLKSYERYTKQRLGDAPKYRFLAEEQAGSNGSKPWSRLSEHLFYTGNTYVLTAKDNALLVLDPWGQRSVEQIAKLQQERRLGKLEVVMFSHAHYDHYDGVYDLPGRDTFEVWTLDRVAAPVAEPFRWRAPFLDARPVRFDRRFQDGDTAAWRDYRFRFLHLPGQSEFTMGVDTTIDGKRCLFTADNWFHQDLYSGTGGWMGLNRSFPSAYAASARKVLEIAPDWVTAEHGGAFEFNAEDWRRRVKWGEEGAKAADALCLRGHHRCDWDPNRVHFEPVAQKARPGDTLKGLLAAFNPLPHPEKLAVALEGRGLADAPNWELDVPAGRAARREVSVRLAKTIPPGRHVLVLGVTGPQGPDPCDAFLVIDVAP